MPGLSSTYGVSKDKLFYEPADAANPSENMWSTTRYLPVVPELFAAAREALGEDVHLLHDVNHRLAPIEAARLGKDLEMNVRIGFLPAPGPVPGGVGSG